MSIIEIIKLGGLKEKRTETKTVVVVKLQRKDWLCNVMLGCVT